MKRLIACMLLLLMAAALVPAAAAASEYPILYTPVKPVSDGVITPEEWGEPDAVMESTDARRPEKIEYWWRYTGTRLYFAVRVHTKNFKNGTHDAGGSYLIPRIQMQPGGAATYTGLISLTENNEVFTAHLGSIGEYPCGARVDGEIVEMEFSFPIYVFSRGDGKDYLSIQLDYHEPKEITNSLPAALIFSEEDAVLPAPAETDPPVTEAPETDPPAWEPAGTVPAETEAPETDPPQSAPAAPVLPIVIGAAAAAAAAAVILFFALRRKKK